MVIRAKRGTEIGGVPVGANDVIFGLTPDQEGLAVQGGDAAQVAATGFGLVLQDRATKKLYGADGQELSSVSGAGNNACRLIIDGDSRGRQASEDNSQNAVQISAEGAFAWANGYAGQVMDLVANFSVGDTTMVDILARMEANFAGRSYTDVALHAGINDIDDGFTVADTLTRLEQYFAYHRRRGARVTYFGDYVPSVSWGATKTQTLMELRSKLPALVAAAGNVSYIDMFPLFVDPASSPVVSRSAVMRDPAGTGFHYGVNGAQLLGKVWARDLLKRYTPADSLIASALENYGTSSSNPNINDYGLFLNSGGTVGTGATAAPAWTSGATVAAGALATNGGNLYHTVAGGTCGSTAPTHTGTAKQDEFGFWYWDPVTASDGAVTWEFVGPGAVAGVGAGWEVKRNTATGSAHVARIDAPHGVGKEQAVSPLGAAASEVFQLGYTSAAATAVAARGVMGASYQAEGLIRVRNPSGLHTTMMRQFASSTSPSVTTSAQYMKAGTGVPGSVSEGYAIRAKTPVATLAASGTPSVLEQTQLIYFSASASAGRGLVLFSRLSSRRVA